MYMCACARVCLCGCVMCMCASVYVCEQQWFSPISGVLNNYIYTNFEQTYNYDCNKINN